MHQDGLICSSSVGFASPAYTFEQEDETKYYIKTTDDLGNETSLLTVTENGALTQKEVRAAEALENDSFAWNIIYFPKTAYYALRNVGTGKMLSYSTQFKTIARTAPTTAEQVQLLPSRTNFKKGKLSTPSYWITIKKMALRVASQTIVNGTNFDASDKNTKQHWLLLTADQFAEFDDYCVEKETGIGESLTPDPSPSERGTIYDLSGRKVNSQFSNFNSQLKRKGIYIKDGKKILF